jgi:hypothetical protein
MKPLTLSTALAALSVIVLTSGLSVSAQTTKSVFEGRAETNTRDDFVPGSSGGGLDFTSIIHNTNLANPRSMGQFRQEQDKNMADQVEKFRNRQPLQIKGLGGKAEVAAPEAKELTPKSEEVIKTP